MTVGLLCIAFIAVSCAEEFLRTLIRWLKTKKEPRKQYFYKRIVAIVSPELHERIKAHVALLNMTITEYVLSAVSEKLKRGTHG